MSLTELMVEVCQRLPRPRWVTDETLRVYETSKPETKADPVVLAAIASSLGCRVRDLSPFVAKEADQLRKLLSEAKGA